MRVSVDKHPSRLALYVASTLISLLAGCTVGPNFRAPNAPDSKRFTEKPLAAQTASAPTLAGASQTLVNGRDIPGDWWTLFHSPQLNALVRRALTANPDIAAAQATLREARENTRAEQGSQYPQVGTTLSREREHNRLQPGQPPSTYSVVSGAVNVSYTLDAFGGIRRQVEQLNAQAEYQRFELEAA